MQRLTWKYKGVKTFINVVELGRWGYSGWEAGQLEAEVIKGDWLVIPANSEMVFDKDPAWIRDRLMPKTIGI